MKKKTILIVGAGSWGTALSTLAASNNHDVFLKTRNSFLRDSINHTNINPALSSSLKLPSSIKAVCDFDSSPDAIIFAVPSESLIEAMASTISENKKADIIIATKGMVHDEPSLFSAYLEKKYKIDPIFLSGSNFAIEVARKLEAAADLACRDLKKAELVSNYLSTEYFFLNPTEDVISVQISSCYKNVLAIYCGYLSALNMGDNFRAKICTEGLKELFHICKRLGGTAETVYSYSGLGDIMLSCFSAQSRNFRYGFHIGEYKKTKIFPRENIEYVEGAKMAPALAKMCNQFYKELDILPKIVSLISNFEEEKCHL